MVSSPRAVLKLLYRNAVKNALPNEAVFRWIDKSVAENDAFANTILGHPFHVVGCGKAVYAAAEALVSRYSSQIVSGILSVPHRTKVDRFVCSIYACLFRVSVYLPYLPT